MGFRAGSRRITTMLLCVIIVLSLTLSAAAAGVKYLPDVTAKMTDYRFWADLQDDADAVILSPEEIALFNQDTIDASGTMVMDLKAYADTFDGVTRNEEVQNSAKVDAESFMGWTYDPETGKLADWSYYQKMIDNCYDPSAREDMPVRYGIAVNRTVLKVLPSDNPIWDDPKDVDFDYQSVSAVRVNEPVLIYTTSRDGKYFLARTDDCSGWIAARDVAVCSSKEEWISAWDLPSEDLLVVYGNRIYTDASIYAPETSRRLLTQGTTLELVKDAEAEGVIINRSPYHNYVVYLPVRGEDGSYEKQKAYISEMAEVSVGYLPLTERNIAMVALENLGDTYGWGGMLDAEDCSGQIRTIYACFGLNISRNGNWQWNMNVEKIDMSNMSVVEKRSVLDQLPLGSALCFSGHEMLYLGKHDGKYYVISTVGSIMSPESGEQLRVRGTIINTLELKRANRQSWIRALNMAFIPCYAKLEGKTYDFPTAGKTIGTPFWVMNDSLLFSQPEQETMLNRGLLAEALWQLEGSPKPEGSNTFADVSAGNNPVCWVDETGILSGYESGMFGPEHPVTYEQLVSAFWRYADYLGYDTSVGETTDLLAYIDGFAVSESAAPAMQWACSAGILTTETSAGIALNPGQTVPKAVLDVLLRRFETWCQQAEPKAFTVDLSQGNVRISAGDPAAVSQDGGATWTALENGIVIVTSAPTENSMVFDSGVPYGELTILLDNVTTTGSLQILAKEAIALQLRGHVTIGPILGDPDLEVQLIGAENSRNNRLTMTCLPDTGLAAGGTVSFENLTSVNVQTVTAVTAGE